MNPADVNTRANSCAYVHAPGRFADSCSAVHNAAAYREFTMVPSSSPILSVTGIDEKPITATALLV